MDARTKDTQPGDAAASAPEGIVARLHRRFRLTPISRRRWENFKSNRRGYWSLWLFVSLFVATLLAEFVANDKPILALYKGEVLVPVLVDYPEEKFGGFLAVTDYKDPAVKDEIDANGWMIWPPIRYSYTSINNEYPRRASRSAVPASVSLRRRHGPAKPNSVRRRPIKRHAIRPWATATGSEQMIKVEMLQRGSSTGFAFRSCSASS